MTFATRRSLRLPLLVALTLALCALVVAACGVDTMTAPGCTNELTPATIRVVMGTLIDRDTLDPMPNRYTVPLMNTDTAYWPTRDGKLLRVLRGGTPGYCLTLKDSLEIHMAGLWAVID